MTDYKITKPQKIRFNVCGGASNINEIILETVSKKFDADINNFDYEIKGEFIND